VQEPNQAQIKSRQKAVAILISIAVGTVIAILVILGRTPESVELPNKVTLAAEVGIGAFIAYLLYYYQERSNKSLEGLVKELHEYNKTRKRFDESVRDPMIRRIDNFLSDFKEQIQIDTESIRNMELSNKKELVTNWLLGYYAKDGLASVFDGPDKVKNLQEESTDVIPYITGELRETLRSIIQNIEILYGIRADLSGLLIANENPAERWVGMSNRTLSQIERAQGSLKSLVQSQKSEPGPTKRQNNSSGK
jgi:hypothetical protein